MQASVLSVALTGTLVAVAATATAASMKIGAFPQEIARQYTEADGLPSDDVLALHADANGLVAVTADGAARYVDGRWVVVEDMEPTQQALTLQYGAWTLNEWASDEIPDDAVPVRQAAGDSDAPTALATADGLYLRNDAGAYEKAGIKDGQGRQWAVEDVRGAAVDADGRLWFATLAGAACRDGDAWTFYTGQEGLPYNDFTCMGAGDDGSVWFGTQIGAIRYKDGQWRYRQGRRWLPGDEVRHDCQRGRRRMVRHQRGRWLDRLADHDPRRESRVL